MDKPSADRARPKPARTANCPFHCTAQCGGPSANPPYGADEPCGQARIRRTLPALIASREFSDAAIRPALLRRACYRFRRHLRPRRRHQGHDLGGFLQSLFGPWPRLRKGKRPSPHHHARSFAWRFAGGDPGAAVARRRSRRRHHGRRGRRFSDHAQSDPFRQSDAARGIVYRHGGARRL